MADSDVEMRDASPQPHLNSAGPSTMPDQAALHLLAMAETFRTINPPKYKLAIKCVMAALKTNVTPQLNAHCHYELGKMLKCYTKSLPMAKFHLEKAYNNMKDLGAAFEESRMQVVCLIAELYIDMGLYDSIKAFLRIEMEVSKKYPFLHAKILFLFAEVYARSKEFSHSKSIIEAGIQTFSESKDYIMEAYFVLSRALLMSVESNVCEEMTATVMKIASLLSKIPPTEIQAINSIKSFCYSVQLCYFLSCGMIKNAKKCLRQLQANISETTDAALSATGPHFQFLMPEGLTALTYMFVVLSSMQVAAFERAIKYSKISIRFIEDFRKMIRKSSSLASRRCEETLNGFEMILFETMTQVSLVIGKPNEALVYLTFMADHLRAKPELVLPFGAQFHTLLGMYSSYMRMPPEIVIMQHNASNGLTKDEELWSFNNLCIAVTYLMNRRDNDFHQLVDKISASKLVSQASPLRSISHFVHALYGYLHSRQQDCKSNIADCLQISREEDLPRIQAMATLLLSQLFECRDRDCLENAFAWSSKSKDHTLIIWANTQIQKLQANLGQLELAAQTRNTLSSMTAQVEAQRKEALDSPNHTIIKVCDRPLWLTFEHARNRVPLYPLMPDSQDPTVYWTDLLPVLVGNLSILGSILGRAVE